MTSFLEFHKNWIEAGCFSISQILAWRPDFNRSSLARWVRRGEILKLRNGWYAFQECRRIPDFSQYIANRIYMPSYISLHTALSHYGMIPEAVPAVTSVSTLKTAEFINGFGTYTYQSIRPTLMFGYELKSMAGNRTIRFATPEKALLDLLYLYPFYTTLEDMLDLRLDEDFMSEDFNVDLFMDFAHRFASPAIDKKIRLLIKAYNL